MLLGNVQLHYHDLKRILVLFLEYTRLLFDNSKNKLSPVLMMFVYLRPIYTAYYVNVRYQIIFGFGKAMLKEV